MREIFQTTILSAALAAALPIAAWAQETQTTEETAPSEGAAPAAEIESQLSLGEDAVALNGRSLHSGSSG